MLKSIIFNFILRILNPKKKHLIYRRLGLSIGKNSTIYGNVSFGSEPFLIKLGDDVRITYGTQFITHDGGMHVLRNKFSEFRNADKFGKIEIKNNVFIGIRSIIMPNVTIGNNVVIGAGSVVTKSIPDNSIAAGVPCRILYSIEEYKEKSENSIMLTKNLNKKAKRNFILERTK